MAMRRFFGQRATIACLLSLVYEPPARAQSPQAQDEVRKADFEKRMADIKRRQSAVLYSDKAARKPWFMVVGLINPHDIMFYDATGEQAKHRMVHPARSEEHTSELQSLMRISYAVFCLKKKKNKKQTIKHH